jgi:choline transport protein
MPFKAHNTFGARIFAEPSQDSNAKKQGNANDRADMYRMGKKQELSRGFRLVSIFSFSTILMSTWEAQFMLVDIMPKTPHYLTDE